MQIIKRVVLGRANIMLAGCPNYLFDKLNVNLLCS